MNGDASLRHGPLYGLPIVVKYLNAVAGVRWTEGSQVHADRVASCSDIMVERLEHNDAIVIAKSNTPEFGAGGNTVSEVFGATRNSWNTTMATGGSSGGSAAAVSSGQCWLATGNDMAGSIRIPSSFCSVVGLRPSPGRVAHGPLPLSFGLLNVDGPIARNAGDAALTLDAMVGEYPQDPLALPAPATSFVEAVDRPRALRRIAWSADLGLGPVDPEIGAICGAAVRAFDSLGVIVEEACPDLTGADQCFQVLRNAQRSAAAGLLDGNEDRLSPEILHYIRLGLAQTARQIADAEVTRAWLFQRMADFFVDYDILATPHSDRRPVRCRYPSHDGSRQYRIHGLLRLAGADLRHYRDGLPGHFDSLRLHSQRIASRFATGRATALRRRRIVRCRVVRVGP